MPYKSEKIRIAGGDFDRRIKLGVADKESIKEKYALGVSLRELGREYGVDKKTIKFVINPDYYKECLAKSREYHYDETPEQRASYMRNHRHHKQNLYLQGFIHLDDK